MPEIMHFQEDIHIQRLLFFCWSWKILQSLGGEKDDRRTRCIFLLLWGIKRAEVWDTLPSRNVWKNVWRNPLSDRGSRKDMRIIWGSLAHSFLKKHFIYLVLERGKGRRKRGRETSMCSCLSCTPYGGHGPQPRHVPWLGIEPVTLWLPAHTQSTEH